MARAITCPSEKPYTRQIRELMAEKSAVLSKAQAFSAMGMAQSAPALWASAAVMEECLAPLMESVGRHREAALHRVSAASCHEKAGDPSRAATLYRAALAGPLLENTRREVEQMLAACLTRLTRRGAAEKPATNGKRRPKSARRATATPSNG